jgi:hypothetical protein
MLIDFTPAEIAEILGFVALVHVAGLLPGSVALAVAGYRRARKHRAWQAVGYWLVGNVLIVVPPIAPILMYGWWTAPILWIPHAALIWYLQRKPRPQTTAPLLQAPPPLLQAPPPRLHAQQYGGWPR